MTGYQPGTICFFDTSVNGKALLHWDDPAFGLQAAPTVTGSYTNVPSGTSPYTNPIPGKGQFLRLISD